MQGKSGAIAQLGERNAGSVEVRSSILLGSTTCTLYLDALQDYSPLRLEA